MKKLVISTIVALTLSGIAHAKTPPEVLKPYKEYRAALKSGDKDKAFKAAKKAWETSEKLLGNHKTTGDLASNFALTTPEGINYSLKDYESRMKAHKRAIVLSKFYDEADVANIELDRHLKRIETGMTLFNVRNGKSKASGKTTYFKDMEKALDKYNLRGSVFEGDMEVLRVRYHELRKSPDKGIEAAKRAEQIYAKPTYNVTTHYPILLKLYKGNVLKDAEQPIAAALEYQDVMQNLEGKLPADHIFVKTAFSEWVATRANLEEDGKLEEAEQAGLCKCWPFEEYKDDVIPLKRIPPIMPRNAKRSGHVNVIFDVDEGGTPFNVRVLSSSEKIFEAPALKSVKKWEYSPIGRGEDAKVRKDVASRITFKLSAPGGRIIPERQ